MTPRRDLIGSQIDALHERLERQLDTIGLESQPRVAQRLLQLSQEPNAQLRDYCDVIKVDWALTGRLLRLANSAHYAQRSPVTKLERAMIVLGIERTKAVSLGFLLSRSAATAGSREVSRQVWGQSVYRASLASAMARTHAPGLAGEAFIVGLLLDCGQPLMSRLLGPSYGELLAKAPTPVKLFQLEYDQCEFTHIDVITALCRKWKLPPLLSRPIAWHHTQPPVSKTADPTALLHKLAYFAGAIQLTAVGLPKQDIPLPSVADRLFEMSSADLERSVQQATREYGGIVSIFADFSESISDVDTLCEGVQSQLVELMDEQMCRALRLETRGGVERFTIAGQTVEIEPGRRGEVVAYISSASGERLISCTVDPLSESADSVGKLLGLDDAGSDDLNRLMTVMRSMAA